MASGPVMLGFVHGGWIRAEFLNSVLNAASGPNSSEVIGGVISSTAGPLVALARNNLVKQFLASDMEWLWTVDTDIVFATDTVDRLLEDAENAGGYPVVSATYYVFDDKGKKSLAAYRSSRENGVLDLKPIENESAGWGLVQVEAVGAGCMLVHRAVFENIQKRADGDPCWFRESVLDGRDFGEDVSFCIRALAVGTPIFVHTGVRVGHIKSAMLGSVS